ncbi:hypothetical protein PVAG01_11270 [Phlyctema vagabunda]|uniref:Ubiquitin-like domain-containing protein n=1 Tax=Phlyctema vagabunda TaxID=108571 RepID=A0ABR4P1T9_9HELO
MTGGTTTEGGNPPPKKRALFNKSKRAPERVVEDDIEESVNFFSRAKDLFPIIVAERERKQKEKAVQRERKRSSASQEEKSPRNEKKRRVSGHNEDESASSPEREQKDGAFGSRRASTHSSPGSQRSRSATLQLKNEAPSTSLAGRYKTDLQAMKDVPQRKQNPQPTGYISLSDSEEDVKPTILPAKSANASRSSAHPERYQQDHIPELDEDEEFPELAARAREIARQKLLRTTSTDSAELQQQTVSDPIVEIFVSSMIEGSKPVMMKRKISQSLKMVRIIWCDKQVIDGRPLDPPTKSSIFLTWRNQRLFDITTCRAMGLRADEHGKLISNGDGFDSDGRLHMEAWNDDLFMDHQRKIEEERRRLTEASLPQSEAEPEEEAESEPEQEVRRIKLIVRARDLSDFKTIVKEATLISQLMAAFRNRHSIEDDKEVALYFDGDRLEPDTTCEDADLGDMDVVEAHVR